MCNNQNIIKTLSNPVDISGSQVHANFSPIRPSSGHFAHFSYTSSQNLARSAQLRHVMSWELLRVRRQMSLFWKGDNQGYKKRRNKNLDPGLHPFGWSCPQIDEGFSPSCTTLDIIARSPGGQGAFSYFFMASEVISNRIMANSWQLITINGNQQARAK